MYPTSFPGLGHGRRAVSGAGSVTAADVGLILDCAFTGALTFAAAATLGNQFQVAFYVSSGTVTLTGNGAETIQSPTGSANTFVLTAGQGAYVSCDGTGLKVILGVGLAPAPATTITTTTIQAATSAGIAINNSSGTQVMLIGPGPGTGVSFAGGVNVTGGTLTVTTVDINGGAIDGTAIGASSRSTGAFTTLDANSTATFTGNITQTGSTTFSTGTGAVSLNGAVTCSNGLTVSAGNLTVTSGINYTGNVSGDNNTDTLVLTSGGATEANIEMYGTGSGLDGYIYYDADLHTLRTANGGTTLAIFQNSGITLSKAVTCASDLTVNGASTFKDPAYFGKAGTGTGGAFRLLNDSAANQWFVGIPGSAASADYIMYDYTSGVERLRVTQSTGNFGWTGPASFSGAVTCSSTLTTADTNLGRTTAGYTNGAGANTGTLTNSPVTGDPTKWIPINDNGTTRYIPAW